MCSVKPEKVVYENSQTLENINPLFIIAGPCRIESPDQIDVIVAELRNQANYIRGGVYRAGTYPPQQFGLDKEMLRDSYGIIHYHGMKNIVEVIKLTDLEFIDQYADAFQVGARQMQNYGLLDELSRTSKPVTIKRHPGSTLDEFLGAAEYLLNGGKTNVILIERGSSTYHNHVRWDLSVSVIAAVKRITALPILVDASHGSGRRDLVEPLILAGIAAGADGFLVEVHPDPEKSMSDAEQAVSFLDYRRIIDNACNIKQCICEGDNVIFNK